MKLLVISQSSSFEQHLNKVLGVDNQILFLPSLAQIDELDSAMTVLIHVASFAGKIESMLSQLQRSSVNSIAIAADKPSLEEMLHLSNLGARAYFNSYMAEIHYRQMVQFVADGQHWYLPGLLESALRIANDAMKPEANATTALNDLTRREQEITSRISKGLSNKEIAKQCGITERTVKAHLTKIFKKSGVSDRVSLAILANASQLFKHTA